MATSIQVKNRPEIRPGTYGEIRSGIQNPLLALDYGSICIIDTNLTDGWAAGSGINGELLQNSSSIYSFNNIDDFRKHVKGGYLWLLAEALFLPNGRNTVVGVSNIFFIKAYTTTAASITFTLTNGALNFQPKDEGSGANGVLTSGVLTKGYAVKLVAGSQDPSKFVFQFWVATFKGLDSQNGNVPYDNVPALDSVPRLVAVTPELSSLEEVVDWCATDVDFNNNFVLESSTVTPISEVLATATATITAGGTGGDTIAIKVDGTTVGTYLTVGTQTPTAIATALASAITGYTAVGSGANINLTGLAGSGDTLNGKVVSFTITGGNGATATGGTFSGGVTEDDAILVSGDISSYPGYTLATGGTESADADDFDAALLEAKSLNNTFFLSTDYSVNGASLSNTKLLDLISSQTNWEKYMFVGGGSDRNSFKGTGTGFSEALAKYYNSDNVIVCHGAKKKSIFGSPSFKTYDSLYFAALALGRTCGLPPQVPITLKRINIDGEVHSLTDKDQEFCLQNGILYSYYDNELGGFVLGQGINTLQNNKFLVNEDGSSFSIAVKRTCTQLIREIIYYSKQTFFSNENGPNRNTVTEEDIKAWLKGFLKSRLATTLQDNLIIRYANVNVTVEQDNYRVTFEFVPNFEISKILFTGFILEK